MNRIAQWTEEDRAILRNRDGAPHTLRSMMDGDITDATLMRGCAEVDIDAICAAFRLDPDVTCGDCGGDLDGNGACAMPYGA